MRFLLIDRIIEWQPGVHAKAVKCVALSEDFFDDHFPRNPIMPGVLLVEGMAQLSGVLLEEGVRQQRRENVKALLSIIDKSKFRAPVRAGETIQYETEVVSTHEEGGKTHSKAFVHDDLVAECSLVFSFHAIEDAYLDHRRAEVLKVWLRGLRENDAL